MHDAIDETGFKEKLGCLESFGKFLTDCLLDDARTSEADECARLGEDDIAKHGETRGDAASGRIGQHRDEQTLGFIETRQRGAGLGHLHERETRFVHACAA